MLQGHFSERRLPIWLCAKPRLSKFARMLWRRPLRAVTVVNGAGLIDSIGFGTNHSYPITSTTAGSTVVAAFPVSDNSISITSITLGGVGGTLIATLNGTPSSNRQYMYRWDNVAAGVTAIPFTFSGNLGADNGYYVETSALGTAVVGSQSGGAGGSNITATVNVPAANSLVFAMIAGVSETVTPPGGYTKFPAAGTSFHFQVYNPSVAAGSTSPSFNASASNNWVAMLVAYPPAVTAVPVAWFTA